MVQNIITKIRSYWEDHQPGAWWCDEPEGTREFFEKIEKNRYRDNFFLKDFAEFDGHSNEKVLEIGCGICTDLIQFAKGGSITIGVDLTKKAVNLGKKRFKLYGYESNFINASAEKLPFKDNSFDYIYSYGVLHHTPDTQKAIDEIFRILKYGKKTTVMLYSKGYFYYIYLLLYKGILKGELFSTSKQELINKYTETGNSPLTKVYSKKEAKALFTKFDDVKIFRRYFYSRINVLLPMWLILQLSRILGWHLIIKATKNHG